MGLCKEGVSFVEALQAEQLRVAGNCRVIRKKGFEVLCPDREEVRQRKEDLSRCLVGKAVPVAISRAELQRWATINWKTPVEVTSLGDGLFLFKLQTKALAQKVLSNGIRRIKESMLLLQRWSEKVGCVECGEQRRHKWISVLGLPFHIRCKGLFEEIGNKCGGFLEAEIGEDGWGEVRIKVIDRGKVDCEFIVEDDQWWYVRFRNQLWGRRWRSVPTPVQDLFGRG